MQKSILFRAQKCKLKKLFIGFYERYRRGMSVTRASSEKTRTNNDKLG